MKLVISLLLVWTTILAQEKRPLEFQDIMEFKEILSPVISKDGQWIAYQLQPDRGDGSGIIQNTEDSARYIIERGSKPYISNNNNYTVFTILPPLLERENAKKGEKPKNGLTVINMNDDKLTSYENISGYTLSENSRWLAVHFADTTKKKDKSLLKNGTELLLNYLPDSTVIKIPFVTSYAFDSLTTYFAAAIRDTASQTDRLIRIKLDTTAHEPVIITNSPFTYYSNLTWNKQGTQLTFIGSPYDSSGYPHPGSLESWQPGTGHKVLLSNDQLDENWTIPFDNKLKFSQDGKRLFFGRLPLKRFSSLYSKKEDLKFKDVTDDSTLLAKTEVDVWHWNDGRINSHQKKEWEKRGKQTFTAVYHTETNQYFPLADEQMPYLTWNENAKYAIGESDVPYLKYITWEGNFYDFYRMDLTTGEKKLILKRNTKSTSFSPGGRYMTYYQNNNWYLVNLKYLFAINLTKSLEIPFSNEDHDYPRPAPGYGIAGWTAADSAVLIYDKYDIWQFPVDRSKPFRITRGRENEITFRIKKLDPEKKYFNKDEMILLEGHHQKLKYTAVYRAQIGQNNTKELLQADKKITILKKAKNKDRILYTEQSYQQFPDIRVTDSNFSFTQKLTDANPQMADLLWGSAELVEWEGDYPLQGVLIKPANYIPGQRYPVVVYFYRFFSQRLYDFNQPKINHRPCFPLYTSNGYAIFLPDIKFEIGEPGPSATECLVSGIEHLFEMGIADTAAIGLHGHSWSGYQTAFVITETDLFKCAIAGAPVSNMTSAYSGIRWGSGLARQFQYEMTQSRIGGSLVEMVDNYIENSPVFYADKINTPLLLMFGDVDEAVPWYQGIELYLALRRHNKDGIFLQYRDEPHHLKKYPNKLDYAKRMKEYFDYHLKGAKPADWIINGVLYLGK